MEKVEFAIEPIYCSAKPIIYDSEKCIGCNQCVQICQCDILFPNEKKGGTPVVMYPGECYYCGACVLVCPTEGAISLRHPLMNQARFIRAAKRGA